MIDINEFAFCFFSSEVEKVINQEKELTKLSDKYLIERWYRHDRNAGKYVSFSQMVNDAIDDTDSEFMIFCNPKTNFKFEDIEFIIDKLSNGYCFASVVSFGFFGFSKELIRQIGMLDERFIGGEYEDDDFAIRLKYFGKAAWWGYNYDKYDTSWSKSGNLKHITTSIFNQKYKIVDNEVLIDNNFFNHKKISKRHRKLNRTISDSWLSDEHNNGNGKMYNYLTYYKTKLVYPELNDEVVNFNFKLERKKQEYMLQLLSNYDLLINIVIITKLSDNRKILWSDEITTNNWKTFNVFYDDEVEIRVFLDDNQIYTNTINSIDMVDLNFKLPKLIQKK